MPGFFVCLVKVFLLPPASRRQWFFPCYVILGQRVRPMQGRFRPRGEGILGAGPPHAPGEGEFRPPGRVTFSTPKKSPKGAGDTPVPVFFA